MRTRSDAKTRRAPLAGLLAVIVLLLHGCSVSGREGSLQEAPAWSEIAPGLELARVSTAPVEGISSAWLVLRIDPEWWRIVPRHFRDEQVEAPLDLEAWVERTGAPVVFNAGFYYEDRRHIGLLLRDGRNLGTGLHPRWKGLLVSDPRGEGLPPMDILDLLETDFSVEDPPYDVALQSLMILADGAKRVRKTERSASRTAVARDERGRILVVWTEGFHTLWELADLLDRSGLGIDRAMALDGGREAQLAVETQDTSLRRRGSLTSGALRLLESRVELPAVMVLEPRARPQPSAPDE